jgi:hypothetical protein
MKERDSVGDLGVDGWMVFKCITDIYDGVLDWVHRIQKRHGLWAFARRVMNLLCVPQNAENFLNS